jgi:hypothetical protein
VVQATPHDHPSSPEEFATLEKDSTPTGKTRTRQHVIADLSVNYLERFILLSGYTLHRVHFDYGYDLAMTTYNQLGEVQPGLAFFQVKATD